jgi:hypothetical protein
LEVRVDIAEARKIAAIVGTADDGCSHCVRGLTDRLNDAFPDFVWHPTDEPQREMPALSTDSDDATTIGIVVAVSRKDKGPGDPR